MNKKEFLDSYIKSYAALVEDIENTVNCLGKKQVLIDLIKDAKRVNLWDIWYHLCQVGYYSEDKRKLRDFALNVVNNCYVNSPSTLDEERNNHEIENAIFNALHKDKEEYFQGLESQLLATDSAILDRVEEAVLSDNYQLIKNEMVQLESIESLSDYLKTTKILEKMSDRYSELKVLKEYEDYMNLNPKIEFDDSDMASVNYWKEQIKQGNHRPILINDELEILDGNHTMVAYQELGVEPPYVYKGTRSDFFKLVANTKPIDALVAVRDMVADGSATLVEWANYRDVTVEELNSNKCSFIVIDPTTGYMSENEFDNLKEVFTYVKQCGGFGDFKDFRWYIKSTYKDGEFYYVRDRFAKGGWLWEDCNGDIVGGFQPKSFRHTYTEDLKSYPITSDAVVKLLTDALRGFNWFVELYPGNKKKLNIITIKSRREGNDKIVGTVNIDNRNRKIYIHYRGEQLEFHIPDSYDNSDYEYEATCRSIDRSMVDLVRGANEKRVSSNEIEPEEEVDDFTGIRQDEDGVYYHYQDGVRGEVASDDDLKEAQRLNEADLLDILNKAKSETPKRVRRSQSLYSEYSGLDSDGTIMFHTDSQTRSAHDGHDEFIFYEGFFDLLDKVDAGDHITPEDVLEIITGDVMIRCTCEDFLYGGFAYMSWNNGYGLQKELRAPDVRNPNREGSACKHCLSVLNLINQSNTLFDKIAKDLDALFQRYKKLAKSKPKKESQVLTEVSELHGDLDPYDLADNLLRLSSDIEVLYSNYDKDNSGINDRNSIIQSLDDIRDFVVNKFGMMGDTTGVVYESTGDATPQGVLQSLDDIYKEIEDLYKQEQEVVPTATKNDHLASIKKIKGFFTKKFSESKKI